jgi:carbon-monoxide dehydrogenase medium subunit
VSIEDFVLGPYFTTREPDELVTALSLRPSSSRAWGFHEIARSAGDFALAGAVVLLELREGSVASARIALLGVEAAPRRLGDAESALAGADVGAASAVAAEAMRSHVVDAIDDPQVPADYRRHLAAVAVERAVAAAVARGVA